jgi:phosphohistidine phosphatase
MVQPASKQMRPCELYLVRHGVAAERGDDWPDDATRPLTTTGVSRFREAVEGLVWFGVGIDEIYSSPLVRARQTADLLSSGLDDHPPVRTLDELAPGHEPARVLAELAKRVKRRRVALVGHEPDFGELAAALLGAQRALPFRKGGVCRIDVDRLGPSASGRLIWFLPPKILRKAGR